jgi:hypothetical protein
MKTSLTVCSTLATLLIGCGAPKGATADTAPVDPSASGSSSESSGDGGDDVTPVTSAESSSTTTPVDDDDGDDDGTTFILQPDVVGGVDCDVWSQDCPDGEKCMPWANNGGNSWNAAKCAPADDNAAEVGDACLVQGSGVSGIDNCVVGSMCWNVDPETNEGTCVAFCSGTEANPICEDPGTSCNILNDGVLILCLPNCDPLIQDCNDGEACYPTNDAFSCVPDAGGENGLYAEPCEFLNVCDPGLFCAVADGVPDCQGSTGCCSPFCDLSDPDASTSCPGAAGGQECVAWYEENQAPPGYENVGACLIPA